MGPSQVNGRLWYPQLDVYDTIRRIGMLLCEFAEPPGLERLYISDFYLANPPLLHRTTMTQETRKQFSALRIPRPDKVFLAYPAPPLLFQKMSTVQKSAVSALAGKKLLLHRDLQRGTASLTNLGSEVLAQPKATEAERQLVEFLTAHFALKSEPGSESLRKSTGLRRIN